MTALLAILTPIALINSVTILPSGIAVVVTSLAARQPYLTAIAFIAGKFLPQFIFGLLIVIGLDSAFDQISVWASDVWRNPNALAVSLQLVIGAIMVVFGYHLSRVGPTPLDNTPSAAMTPANAFTLGAGLTVFGLPANLFYFAAIDQILRADLLIPGTLKAVLFYNVVFLAPLMLVVLSRWLFGTRADPLFEAVARFTQQRGKRIVFFGMLGIGAVLVADAIGWFFGFQVLPSYIR